MYAHYATVMNEIKLELSFFKRVAKINDIESKRRKKRKNERERERRLHRRDGNNCVNNFPLIARGRRI